MVRSDAVSFSIYGMKPPGVLFYTGIMPIETFAGHTGPMTANVADNALLLEVFAGDDGYDPRIKAPKVQEYTKARHRSGTEDRHRRKVLSRPRRSGGQ